MNCLPSISLGVMNKRHHFARGGLEIGDYDASASMDQGLFSLMVFFFHQQMPFHNKVIAQLYNAIVTDEVECRRKLSRDCLEFNNTGR